LDFERCAWATEDDGVSVVTEWQPLTRETAEQTQQLICDTLGLSRTTFRASAFLAQGDGAAFTEAQPRERKAILAEILGLDVYERLQDRARVDLRGREDDLIRVQALIAGCQEQAARKPHVAEELALQRSRLTAARNTLAEATTGQEQAAEALLEARTHAQRIAACEAELAAAVEKHVRASEDFAAATKAAHTLADKQIELEELEADAKHVADLEAKLVALRGFAEMRLNALGARATLTTEADQRDRLLANMIAQAKGLNDDGFSLRSKAQHLLAHIGESAQCDRCGQTLGREAAERAASSYLAEAEAVDAKAQALDAEIETLGYAISDLRQRGAAIEIPEAQDPVPTERILAAARRAAEQAASVRAQIVHLTDHASRREHLEATLTETAAEVADKQTALDAAKETVVDLTAANARAERWKIAVEEARGLIEKRSADVVRAEAEYDRCEEAAVKLAEHRHEVAMLQERVDLLKLAEKAYGRDGIPALILESSAVPWIETEGNRILAELGTPYRVELRTQAANKTNAVLRETLEIVVNDGDSVRAYETFSGGEKTRLNLALRLALAGLLAHRRGAESRVLCIDELDGLDAAGMDRLVEVLRRLGDTFSRILLVTHQAQLATAFDQTISVEKEDGRSRIAGTREEVAA
jgi:exonuclease SbcC